MHYVHLVTQILIYIISGLVAYQILYLLIGIFCKKKTFKKSEVKHKYGIIISARNEEKVIGNLIKSIQTQNYPQDKLQIFVVADNCTDKTAEICRNLGATVYERFDEKKKRKGWAVQWLFERIKEDYGIDSFEGYFMFDADNILDKEFVSRINDAFDGSDVVLGYRNTKNFDDNLVSAACGIHFYESIISFHRPREFLNTTTHVQGTGYMFKNYLVKDGWNWTTLTEDTELSLIGASKGWKIRFCEDAVFYDEQPTKFRTVLRQRIRWTKGRLAVFFKNGYKAIASMFKRGFANFWANFDMFMYTFPTQLFTTLLTIIYPVTSFIVAMATGRGIVLKDVYQILITMGTGLGTMYLRSVVIGIVISVREKKNIICKKSKMALYVLTWFWYDLISLPISIVCLFMHVGWKPIKHDAAISIDQLDAKKDSLQTVSQAKVAPSDEVAPEISEETVISADDKNDIVATADRTGGDFWQNFYSEHPEVEKTKVPDIADENQRNAG